MLKDDELSLISFAQTLNSRQRIVPLMPTSVVTNHGADLPSVSEICARVHERVESVRVERRKKSMDKSEVQDAMSEMEPEISQSVTHEQVETQIRKLFDYCGRPLDSELKHDEIGFKAYLSGHQKPMRKLYYAARTTQYPKGVCLFSVKVAPVQNGLGVTRFGPMKLQSGELLSGYDSDSVG
jgi:hypothetical protein